MAGIFVPAIAFLYVLVYHIPMKGHDGLCPTPNPHLIEPKYCAYCNLIKEVKEHYKKGGKNDGKTYDDGFRDGLNFAVKKLQEA